jgi:hypothetical protein
MDNKELVGEAELKLSFYPVTVFTWNSTLYLQNPPKIVALAPFTEMLSLYSAILLQDIFTFVPAWYSVTGHPQIMLDLKTLYSR